MDKDISTLLREIKTATGWSEHRIATEILASQPTVNRILNGQPECKSSTFRSITELHKQQCPDDELLARRRDDGPAPPSVAVANA